MRFADNYYILFLNKLFIHQLFWNWGNDIVQALPLPFSACFLHRNYTIKGPHIVDSGIFESVEQQLMICNNR